MTVGGYSRTDNEFKDAKTVVRNLADICGKGGNYLLNIAPTDEGIIRKEARDILAEVGRWLEINGEAIYGTTPGGPGIVWNKEVDAITTKPGKWFIHIFDWPEKRKVFLRKSTRKSKTPTCSRTKARSLSNSSISMKIQVSWPICRRSPPTPMIQFSFLNSRNN
ncbi:MAG: hypothetical protein HC901_00040 [Bdellovibrionaceae bacterium]|nr:hypothetical protein [Pseudobdellovibrionaceae bacterium]